VRGLLFLVPVILLWASTPLLVTELSRELPVYQINTLATFFGLIVLALGLTVFRHWGTLARYRILDRGRMLLLGAAGIFPYTALYYLAFALAPSAAGDVNIINYLWPIWVLVLSAPLLKERLGWSRILSVLLGFLGVYLLVSGGGRLQFRTEHWQAYLCAGSGALFWGLFSVLSKRQRYEPLPAMFLYSLGAMACFTAVALSAMIAVAGAGARIAPLAPPSLRAWLLLLLLGGGANGLGYLCWILALRGGDTARMATLAYLTPVVALFYLAVFQGTPVRPLQLVSLALILAGPIFEGARARQQRQGRQE
jgi:drug/metabolite transporter (DMT)-like permease